MILIGHHHIGALSQTLALKESGVNYVIFKVLINKPIAYSLKH